ncbi:MAG: DNA-binding protein YbiB [Burkholderiales bacterium]|nr:DNA-binding protein YbiB [Burkholderiales bacterium]
MTLDAHLKSIGRGASGSQALSRDAAEAAMAEVLDGRAGAAEVGAFVMAMRMKGETLDELVGFLAAVQARTVPVPSARPVVLIPSYNGSRKLPNLTPLLALWLAREGLQVLVHGPLAEPSRVTSAAVLSDLGLQPVLHPQEIARAWSRREPAFVPTGVLCPPLQALLDLRRVIGLRGPGHTVAKMLDPVLGAPTLRLVNHTHPEFGALMSAWAQRERIDAVLLRGTEGEPVADPRRQPRIDTWLGGELHPELSVAAQEGVLTELPLLPRATDPASTAVYVQEVLSGMRPAPPPLARQVALIVAAAAALARRRGARELSA